jgi:regulator-associated protein of mTOR
MVCDDQDGISIWDYEKGSRSSVYKNGHRKGSRMTTARWINESSSSLFFVGCDDGSARIWDGIVESNGAVSKQSPKLVTSFLAVPDMSAGQRGSGLICEWQQFSGTLVAGGNSNYIRCWDLGSEQCGTVLETNTDACITTLTTAWDADQGIMPGGYNGMGPETIVAGLSDGTLRVFDIRSPEVAARSGGRRSRRPTRYTEHGSWIVDTAFTGYGGRFELISGSVAGDIKAWDLRMSGSLRTLDAQRSPMTALSAHKKIPIIATGSHAQFIKILTLEGEALQVVRFHETSGHRIGPVSCLEFHPHKLVLAAGATNSLVSIYKPKRPPSL